MAEVDSELEQILKDAQTQATSTNTRSTQIEPIRYPPALP